MMGVDEAVLISDRRFAGADVLATSRALSQAILAIGEPGIILCGQQTTDGDTAQVGSEIAEFLDIPHAANVTAIPGADARSVTAELDLRSRRRPSASPSPA
jgi:electron transfer flavoprotein beta subunit